MQLIEPAETDALTPLGLSVEQEHHIRSVRNVVEDVDTALELLGATPEPPKGAEALPLPKAALIAGRSRRQLETLTERRQLLEEERALILKFRPFFSTFQENRRFGPRPRRDSRLLSRAPRGWRARASTHEGGLARGHRGWVRAPEPAVGVRGIGDAARRPLRQRQEGGASAE